MRRRHERADARFVARDGRKRDALREHAFLKQPIRQLHRKGALTRDHRRDRTLAEAGVESERFEPFLEEPRVLPEPIDDLRFLLQHVDRGDAGGGDRRRMRRREQERTRAMIEKLDQRLAARDVPAERADRLRQRPDLNVHAAVHPEMIDRAAPVLAEHPAGVRIVHHHDAPELFGQRAQLGHHPDIAVHAEDTVGDEQLALVRRQLLQDFARGGRILVRKHFDRRPAQTAAVDDARVIQLVGDDDVIFG